MRATGVEGERLKKRELEKGGEKRRDVEKSCMIAGKINVRKTQLNYQGHLRLKDGIQELEEESIRAITIVIINYHLYVTAVVSQTRPQIPYRNPGHRGLATRLPKAFP